MIPSTTFIQRSPPLAQTTKHAHNLVQTRNNSRANGTRSLLFPCRWLYHGHHTIILTLETTVCQNTQSCKPTLRVPRQKHTHTPRDRAKPSHRHAKPKRRNKTHRYAVYCISGYTIVFGKSKCHTRSCKALYTFFFCRAK